ncbi:MAG TPA: hypothetical protein VGH80_09570 [Xanthomonadaceae bacterium]|jgi:hypothetical protein
MDRDEAFRAIRAHVGNTAGLTLCAKAPAGLYRADDEVFYYFLLRPSRLSQFGVDGEECFALNKSTGEVEYAGTVGE